MLLRSERRAAHGRIVDWIESAAAGRTDEYLDLLAHHAVEAGQSQRAIHYLIRAGERARQTAAHRSEAALLTQALDIAGKENDRMLTAELLARRGRAFIRAAIWQDARADLEVALQEMPTGRTEARAEIMVDLAAANMWAFGHDESHATAEQALSLLQGLNRPDLVVGAMTYLAMKDAAGGDPIAGLKIFDEADVLAKQSNLRLRESTLQGTTMHSVVLYWAGKNDDAVRVGRGFLAEMRDRNESVAQMFALPHLGLALAAKGAYGEALQVFDEARRLGREYEIWGPLARATSMSAGFHLELSDFAAHRELAEEAREIGETRFPPTLAFTGVDLLLNAARRGEPGEVEGSIRAMQEEVSKATAWHRWLSTIRLYEALAELALARGNTEEAIRWATETIEKSRSVHRLKYEALGLETRAAAFRQANRLVEAIADLRLTVQIARGMDDPALFVRVSAPLLELDGDNSLAAEAATQVDRILANLPDNDLRRRFATDERVRVIARLAPSFITPSGQL